MMRIVAKEEVVPNVHRMVIDAPLIARKVKPGNFIIVMPDEVGERIPLSVSDWDAEKGTVTVFFLEVGVSTMKMAQMSARDELYSVVGPLGKPATLQNWGTVFLGGGCYGIGAIYPIARALKQMGNRVVVAIEARSEYLLYNLEELGSVADELLLGTSDGSAGVKGKVWDIAGTVLERENVNAAYFVGCTFMMMNSSNATKDKGTKAFVALNALMLDGTGMCGCCRVSVDGQTKFACVDGPEFDGHKVDWEELFQRKGMYADKEVVAYQYHTCRALEGRCD